MNLVELDRALRQLRLSGMAAVLETRLRQAQAEKMTPIDLVSALVTDELHRRQDRLLERRHKLARFRDPDRSLDTFDFDFNKKMNRALLTSWPRRASSPSVRMRSFSARPAPGRVISPRRSDAPPSSKAIASSTAKRTRCWKNSPTRRSPAHARTTSPSSRPCRLLVIDDLGMRKLAHTAAEDLLELISCGGTNGHRPCSRRIDRWTTGANCLVTRRQSRRCSIDCCSKHGPEVRERAVRMVFDHRSSPLSRDGWPVTGPGVPLFELGPCSVMIEIIRRWEGWLAYGGDITRNRRRSRGSTGSGERP